MARYADREHVIPLRKAELVRLLLRQPGCPSPEDEYHFRQFCRLVEAIFHFKFHQCLEVMKELYAPFDPDTTAVYPITKLATTGPSQSGENGRSCVVFAPAGSDSVRHTELQSELAFSERARAVQPLLLEVRHLLERANFRRVERAEIERACERPGKWGLHFEVNFDLFETLELYARGNSQEKEKRPARLFGLIPEREVEVDVYERLVLLVRFRADAPVPPFVDKECLYIKLFKDVPRDDLEMLIPGTEPRIRPLDGFKIGFPLVLGMIMFLWKLVIGAALTLASGIMGILAWLGIIGAPISYGVRSYFGYVSTRQKYQLTVTQCLFFQTLDNNLGAICHLLDEAEEQEFRETVLSWFLLWRFAGDQGWTAEELDDAIEQYLQEQAHLSVDFEIEDALRKLCCLGLVFQDGQKRWRAVPLLDACRRLDEKWDNYFRYNRNLLE